jgi:hypothetical protein
LKNVKQKKVVKDTDDKKKTKDNTTDKGKTEVKQETDFLNLLLPSSKSIADDDFQDGEYSDDDQDSNVEDWMLCWSLLRRASTSTTAATPSAAAAEPRTSNYNLPSFQEIHQLQHPEVFHQL